MTNADPSGSYAVFYVMLVITLTLKLYMKWKPEVEPEEKTQESEKERLKKLLQNDRERLDMPKKIDPPVNEWVDSSNISDSTDADDVYPAFFKEPVAEKKPVEKEVNDLEEWQEVRYKKAN